jgi:thiol-disulfide isomerase/thioredoxin
MRAFIRMLLALTACSIAGALDVGDAAPPLSTVTWVKGEAPPATVSATVVEFWATSCGPCRTSIPHLSALQHEYGNRVAIIGLSDEDQAIVKPFVEKMGDQMGYRVGIADKPTREAWMNGFNGIPHAFIVDARNTVAWVGHPMEIKETLAQVMAGTFDVAHATVIARLERTLNVCVDGIASEQDAEGISRALVAADDVIEVDPFNGHALQIRLAIARHNHDPALFRQTYADMPVNRMTADCANAMAWKLAMEENLSLRNLDLALAFIAKANDLQPRTAAFHNTRARILYDLGLFEQAILEQGQAVELDPGDAGMRSNLDAYENLRDLAKSVSAAEPSARPPSWK